MRWTGMGQPRWAKQPRAPVAVVAARLAATASPGAARVLFGSGFPTRARGPAVTALADARISDADRARIAGDNLRSLLHGVKP